MILVSNATSQTAVEMRNLDFWLPRDTISDALSLSLSLSLSLFLYSLPPEVFFDKIPLYNYHLSNNSFSAVLFEKENVKK